MKNRLKLYTYPVVIIAESREEACFWDCFINYFAKVQEWKGGCRRMYKYIMKEKKKGKRINRKAAPPFFSEKEKN